MKTFLAWSGVVFWCLVIVWLIGYAIAWLTKDEDRMFCVKCGRFLSSKDSLSQLVTEDESGKAHLA